MKIKAVTVRNEEGLAGLQFLEDSEKLRHAIAESATEVLRAQQANLEGVREHNVVDGEETLTTISAGLRASGYATWTLEEKGWRKRKSLLPDQPAEGFTIAASEPEESVALLRKMARLAKETLDEQGDLLAAYTITCLAYYVGMLTYDAFSFVQVTLLFFLCAALGLRLRTLMLRRDPLPAAAASSPTQ